MGGAPQPNRWVAGAGAALRSPQHDLGLQLLSPIRWWTWEIPASLGRDFTQWSSDLN
jgi:hypothetical protein